MYLDVSNNKLGKLVCLTLLGQDRTGWESQFDLLNLKKRRRKKHLLGPDVMLGMMTELCTGLLG